MLRTKLSKTKFIIVLFAISLMPLIPGLAFAQDNTGLGVSAKDWQYPDGGSWGGAWSPQTQITKDNVDRLEVKWLYPTGGLSLAPEGIRSARLMEGANVPPIVTDGKVIVGTNFNKLYAMDANDGSLLWTYDYEVDYTAQTERLPLSPWGTHLHAIRYWEKENVVLMNGFVCDFIGVDANTGEEKFKVVDTCLNIPGNAETFRANAAAINVVGTYDKGNMFIYHNPGAVPGPSAGRTNTMGVDYTSHAIKWRIFQYPPSPGEPDWALQECSVGFFASPSGPIPCEEVLAVNRDALMYDWQWNPALATGPHDIYLGQTGWSPSPYFNVGTSGVWGQPMIDESSGMLYVGQAQASPDGNGTLRPGPNLYATASMGINMDSGKRIWWMQHDPHDLRDYDNNWGGMIKDIRLPNGSTERVFIKGAKDGYLYAMDAMTGESHWWIDSLKDTERWGYFSRDNGDLFDPKSFEDMTRPWLSYGDPQSAGRPWAGPSPTPHFPSADNPLVAIPGWFNGHFATDLAFHDNVIFHYGGDIYTEIIQYRDASLRTSGSAWSSNRPMEKMHTSIIARDAGDGGEIWHVKYPGTLTRGAMLITGGMVVAPFPDGALKFHDELTGTLLKTINLGGVLATGVTTGQDNNGNQLILTIVGQGTIMSAMYGPATPGTVIAFGLADAPSGQQTVTRTSTSVSITTQTSTRVQTTTEVTTSTSEVGLSSTITYAAIAIAVIAVISAAVLYTRKT